LKKHLHLIIVFLIIVSAAAYLGFNFGLTKHYDNGEISFDYPQGWDEKPGSNPSQVVSFQPSPNLNITINKQVIPPGYQSPEDYILNSTTAYDSGFRLISSNKKTINMDVTYENTYNIERDGNIYLQKEVWIPKNGNLYTVIYTQKMISSDPLYDLGSTSNMEILTTQYGFEVIKNNFKVNSVLIPAKTPFWGSVSIPTLDVNWGIRSDTVNGYNSVFYYGESSYPDRNSTMGLLGHRTIFSAPFKNIDQLKPEDEVVINDYLTQRKYIYQVVSNGDIKWDYKTDPIKFPPGDNNLTLVTCYPPGTTQAAWMVHCKLIRIKPLN